MSPDWKPYVEMMAAFYYNTMHRAGKGGVINTKGSTMPAGTDVLDFERGQACTILPAVWQTDTSISRRSWGFIENDSYKSAQSMIGNLVDIVSKNGALLMNVGPAKNGTIPAAAVDSFLKMGDWLSEAGDGIYGTRPYHIFGEGPTLMGCGAFAAEEVDFTPQDFRFTSKGNNTVFALAMGAKGGQEVVVKALGKCCMASGVISGVEILGHGAAKWAVDAEGLRVTLPATAGQKGPAVLAVHGLRDVQWDGVVRQGQDGSAMLIATNVRSMTGGAKLDTVAHCTGVITGNTAAIAGLGGASKASWTFRVKTAGALTPALVVSSVGRVSTVIISAASGELPGGSSVSISIPSTKPGEFVAVKAPTPLHLPHGDVDITVSVTASPAPPPGPSPPATWVDDDGVNYFNGCSVDGKIWVALGKQESKQACLQACKSHTGCQAYTWHDAFQGSFAKVCVGRMDGHYRNVKEEGHFSGRLNITMPTSSCTGGAAAVELQGIRLVMVGAEEVLVV